MDSHFSSRYFHISSEEAYALFFLSTLAYMFAIFYAYLVGQFTWVKLGSLEALLRPVEQLDTEVEIGCRLSWMYD